MRIALLEWSCGGGLLDAAAGPATQALCGEGWLMLQHLVDGLSGAGLQVITPVDTRIVPPAAWHASVHIVDISPLPPTSLAGVLQRWSGVASECDYAWVIAPEIDGLLPKILHYLRSGGHQLLNCHGDFLRNGSDKSLTAAALAAAGIPHPATAVLAEVDEAWLATTTQSTTTQSTTKQSSTALPATALSAHSESHCQAEPRWIIKPATGAGGVDQRLVTRTQLLRSRAHLLSDPDTLWLVQPWLLGQSASCPAIVDAQGARHWLPLVSQDFEVSSSDTAAAPHYVGCTYPCAALPAAAPRELLDATLDALGPGAFGPVGIDLLFDPLTCGWTVIEINARCTSSLLAMAAAHRGNLVGRIVQLLTQPHLASIADLSSDLHPFQFRLPP